MEFSSSACTSNSFTPRLHPQLKVFSFPLSIRTPSLSRTRRLLCLWDPMAAALSLADIGGGGGGGVGGRKVYRQSQAQRPIPAVPVKEIASAVVPDGAFLAITFVLWNLVEKVLVPKPKGSLSVESKSSLKWSFAPGTNLPSAFNFKIERDSREKLNDFAKELRSFRSVDMSGRNFGDEGLFFLAESLGYNQIVEEVDISGNGITAAGLKAFDGILRQTLY